MSANKRLDLLLIERGIVQSRERAKARIMAGQVLVDGKKIDKPGTGVNFESEIRLLGEDLPFVSRGGLKLAGAIEDFNLKFNHKTVLDVGASTGGFTDCALKHGAVKVFAVDVGYGQLAWKLRQDPRVVNMERTNARYLSPEDLGENVDTATIDVAFISLKKILPSVFTLIKPDGEIIALIKPQFEAGRERVGKKGVVKDPEVHKEVIQDIFKFTAEQGWFMTALSASPIKGPEGNIEFLSYLQMDYEKTIAEKDIIRVVEKVWN